MNIFKIAAVVVLLITIVQSFFVTKDVSAQDVTTFEDRTGVWQDVSDVNRLTSFDERIGTSVGRVIQVDSLFVLDTEENYRGSRYEVMMPSGYVIYVGAHHFDEDLVANFREKAHQLNQQRDERQRQRQQQAREQCLENAGSDRMERAVCDNKIIIGMSKSQVRRAWGEPNDINRTTSAHGTREQWVYGSLRNRSYVYFRNGTLTIIQD